MGWLNLLTPQKVLQGIAEVRAGRTFCLSLPLDCPGGSALNPRRQPPGLKPTLREGRPQMALPLRCFDPRALDIVSDDQVQLALQYSTQWDTLAHVGQMLMIGLEAHYGRSGTVVGYDELMAILDKDKVEIKPGDLVCLRTGFADLLLEMGKQPDPARLHGQTSTLDGRDERLLR